jgi:hypothetical protein
MAESSPEWQMAWRFSKGVWRKIARSWARYLVGFLRYGSIPFLMSVGLQCWALAGGDDLPMVLIVGLLKSLLLSFFLVIWMRHILISEGFVVSKSVMSLPRRVARCFGAGVIFNIVLILPAVLFVLISVFAVAPIADLQSVPGVWIAQVLILAVIGLTLYVLADSLLAFPAIAADADHSIWDLLYDKPRKLVGTGHAFLFVLAGPAVLLSFAAYYGMEVDESSNYGLVIASNGVKYLLYAWNGACLALAYRELMGRQEAMEFEG